MTPEDKAVELLCELEGLMDAFADRVEKIAFSMTPPNPYTPQLVQTVQYVRGELARIKQVPLSRCEAEQ